ncbi:MAG TPA: cupin domain-containing protein [Clostridia bacterium]|nr:cupin domain-containing protein [Clostridia bacterium]
MIVGRSKDVTGMTLQGEGIHKVVKKVLVSPKEGWEGWVMRLFELGAGGYTPKHAHPWPHINWIAGGRGTLYLEGKEYEIRAGDYAYVPSNALHRFKAAEDSELSFVCIVPEEGDV